MECNNPPPMENFFDTSMDVNGVCSPWSDPIRFPMIIFVVLMAVIILLSVSAISKAPMTDRHGHPITTSQKWVVGVITILILLIIGLLFGWWMYSLSRRCEAGNAWLVFLFALLTPVLLYVVSTVIIAVLLGLNQAVWMWSKN